MILGKNLEALKFLPRSFKRGTSSRTLDEQRGERRGIKDAARGVDFRRERGGFERCELKADLTLATGGTGVGS